MKTALFSVLLGVGAQAFARPSALPPDPVTCIAWQAHVDGVREPADAHRRLEKTLSRLQSVPDGPRFAASSAEALCLVADVLAAEGLANRDVEEIRAEGAKAARAATRGDPKLAGETVVRGLALASRALSQAALSTDGREAAARAEAAVARAQSSGGLSLRAAFEAVDAALKAVAPALLHQPKPSGAVSGAQRGSGFEGQATVLAGRLDGLEAAPGTGFVLLRVRLESEEVVLVKVPGSLAEVRRRLPASEGDAIQVTVDEGSEDRRVLRSIKGPGGAWRATP